LFLVASKMTTTNKISVLIPSRNRTIQLVNSVRQILTMAADPGRVEILLRLDCDDEASLRAYRGLRLTVPAIAVVDDRYMGWMSNHVFYNALARQASGDWLLLYNDDAQMLTSAWDNRIMAATKPVVATRMLRSKECEPWRWRAKNGQWMGNCFPAVRRDAYELLGQFARHRHADVYWEWITGSLGLQEPTEIDILHAPTSSVLPETRGPGWWDDFNTDPLKPLLEQDRLKLKEAFCRELL
jgi:glycosyltransferase involved in cell wall biosynthesis